MADSPHSLLWTDPEWLAEAHTWIGDSLARLDRPLTGSIQQIHTRPWSTILRAPTGQGFMFFKAAMPLLAREAALQQALFASYPHLTLPVLAADLERGWFLQPDGGPLLRTFLKNPADLNLAVPLLERFAVLQIDLTPRTDEFLHLVPFDRRLQRIPVLFNQLLNDRRALRIGEEDGLSEEDHQRLRTLLPRLRQLCSELLDAPIPHSLHHDDFHDGNIFADSNGEARFISDWGESCVTHPFFSLIVCLRAFAFRVGLPDSATDVPEDLHAALIPLRDAYLAPWEVFAPRPILLHIFNTAWRVGMVNRALTWHRVVASLPAAHRPDYADAVPGWLSEFLTLMSRT